MTPPNDLPDFTDALSRHNERLRRDLAFASRVAVYGWLSNVCLLIALSLLLWA